MNLYPLRLEPQFRERIWGTRDLSPVYQNVPGTELIGEVWLTGDECRVTNGPLAGQTLAELCRRYGRELVGETARAPDRFPLLVKFLFPHEKLSVQVHPDDEGARRVGQPNGKTECWYVLDARPGAQVGLGLKPGTTRQQLKRAIAETRAETLLNWIDLHAGDMIYVDSHVVKFQDKLIESGDGDRGVGRAWAVPDREQLARGRRRDRPRCRGPRSTSRR